MKGLIIRDPLSDARCNKARGRKFGGNWVFPTYDSLAGPILKKVGIVTPLTLVYAVFFDKISFSVLIKLV
jgi:hypothetical protein